MLKFALIICFATIMIHALAGEPRTVSFLSTFDDLKGWKDNSSEKSPHSYSLTNGALCIYTRAQTRDRVKVATTNHFGAARYSWRVYVPALGEGDQASIGAFLYRDDQHEIDFEIGYGARAVRKKLGAEEADLVCYCTSQGNPSSSSQYLIKREAWYLLSLNIVIGKNGKYLISWFINGKQVKQLQTSFGSEVTFTAHCSVENLNFIGDHIPTAKNYALFDYVEIGPSAD
jgi:hypothetical protein